MRELRTTYRKEFPDEPSGKKRTFFVAGFPRSRSAWLATLLTWGDCFCFHDGLANIESLDELDKKFNSVPGNIVGNSDPANLLFHDALMKRYPDAKWIVVERPVEEAMDSLKMVSGLTLDSSGLVEQMRSLKSKLKPSSWIVDFYELDDVATLQSMANYIGVRMPIQRYYELVRLNIRLESLRNVSTVAVEKMKRLKESLNECVLA